MPRRFLTHHDSERAARITSLGLWRPRLLDVDVDRKKSIDATIDYFGLRDLGADPCGESLLDAPGPA